MIFPLRCSVPLVLLAGLAPAMAAEPVAPLDDDGLVMVRLTLPPTFLMPSHWHPVDAAIPEAKSAAEELKLAQNLDLPTPRRYLPGGFPSGRIDSPVDPALLFSVSSSRALRAIPQR